jgi:hypothetical protein
VLTGFLRLKRGVPLRNDCERCSWPLGRDLQIAGIDAAGIAIERQHVALIEEPVPDPALPPLKVDIKPGT